MVERFERRIGVVDIFMMALAIVSVGLLVYSEAYPVSAEIERRIILIDLVIVGIFAVEFLVRVAQAENKKAYVKGHWYDLVGLVPVAHPIFRGFRLARLVRLFAIASRILRATDRSLGEAFMHRQMQKYRSAIVEELTTPMVLAVFSVTEQAVLKGNYGSAVADGLRENRDDVVARIHESMSKDRALSLLLRMPGIGKGIEQLPGRVLDGVIETFGTSQMDETIRDVLRRILGDLRTDLAVRTWRQGEAVPEPA